MLFRRDELFCPQVHFISNPTDSEIERGIRAGLSVFQKCRLELIEK